MALQSAGAELIQGDMNDSASLLRAASGMGVVFSVQRPDADGSDSERRHGYALIDAARAAGVSQGMLRRVVLGEAQRSGPLPVEGRRVDIILER